jgi:hypothetical protein
MPATLDATYERVLDAIEYEYFEEARTALQWLVFSNAPLTVAELAAACSIRLDDVKGPSFQEGGHDALIVLFGIISSFILIGTSSNNFQESNSRYSVFESVGFGPSEDKYDPKCYSQHVRLAHFSVKEYLVSSRLQQSNRRRSRYAERSKTPKYTSIQARAVAHISSVLQRSPT